MAVLALVSPAAAAGRAPRGIDAPTGLTATVAARSVQLAWTAPAWPRGSGHHAVEVLRDGQVAATVAGEQTSYDDAAVAPGQTHSYALVAHASRGAHQLTSAPTAPVSVTLPGYLVGAATRDITPAYGVNLGGFGFGDGSVVPEQVAGRGGHWDGPRPGVPATDLVRARALVVDDGHGAVAIANIETQGMFAAYSDGPYGLADIAAQVARDVPALPVDHIVIASDHTHHGPDTIGAWGGVPRDYLQLVHDQTVAAIEQAYAGRQFASIRAGQSDASDLVYNQACSEALNQSKQPAYPGPDFCPVPGKDGMLRAVQATAPGGAVVATLVVFAAHATSNIGSGGLDGDWPQFLADRLAATYGGVGIGMEGANGGTQPCRPTCAFTKPSEPGYGITDRYTAVLANYMAHTTDALDHAQPVTGPVAAARGYIREPLVGPFAAALFTGGSAVGARLLRDHQPPWVNAETVRTVVADVRIGSLLFNATPGEGFPAIRQGVADAVQGPAMVVQLGLANDQLGYLIAPATYYPTLAAEVAVNDNVLFNVSPTIGDHVMCADITLAKSLGGDWSVADPAGCAGYDISDQAQAAAGDPVGQIPVGGVTLP